MTIRRCFAWQVNIVGDQFEMIQTSDILISTISLTYSILALPA